MLQTGSMQSVEGDSEAAFEHLTKAAELGDAIGHHCLSKSKMYLNRESVVEKDMKRCFYHAEEAAIKTHPEVRFMARLEEI